MPDISLSRRTLMEASVASVLLTGATAASAKTAEGASLELRHFVPLVGENFHITPVGSSGAPSHALVLRQAGPLTDTPRATDPQRSFRLVFECPGTGVAQDTWQLEHPALGRHAVFLSPNDAQGRLVEAVFLRL